MIINPCKKKKTKKQKKKPLQLISPYNITPKSHIKVTKLKEVIPN